MVPIKYEIGPATEKFGTRLIIDVHGDVLAEVPMLLNSKCRWTSAVRNVIAART